MSSNNVIIFPKVPLRSPPHTMEELRIHIDNTRKDHIEYIIDEMMPRIFSWVEEEGFNIIDENCVKSTALFIESFKAVLYKSVEIDHFLHQVAEDSCEIIEVDHQGIPIITSIKEEKITE